MRVLMTGITRLECGMKPQLRYISNAELFADVLRRAGVDVDFRVVMPGDDLTGYDVAFIGLGPFLSITAGYLNGALYTIGQAAQHGCALAFYMDDWNFTRTVSNLRTIRNTGIQQLTKRIFHLRPGHDWVMANEAEVLGICLKLLETPWPTTVIPATRWGDASLLIKDVPATSVVTVDPSVVAETYHDIPTINPRDKMQRWVLGVLKDERPWLDSLNLSWETRYAGGIASKAEERHLEAELVKLYAESWGVLSPPHKRVLGTGWWRYRFTAARMAGSILLSDPDEMPKLGSAFTLDPSVVEDMTTRELTSLASEQAQIYDQWKMPMGEVTDRLMRVIREARTW